MGDSLMSERFLYFLLQGFLALFFTVQAGVWKIQNQRPAKETISKHLINPVIDADYPGGNILVYKSSGRAVMNDTVYLRQDLRDMEWWWFYWNFRVRGAEGRTLHFKFCLKHPRLGILPFGTQGPGVSTDGGNIWTWLGADAVKEDIFTYTFAPNAQDVGFCFTIPYQQRDLDKFINRHKENPHFSVQELCKTRKDRTVNRLHAGRLQGNQNIEFCLPPVTTLARR